MRRGVKDGFLSVMCGCVVPEGKFHQSKRGSDGVAVRSSQDGEIVGFVSQSSDLRTVLSRFLINLGRPRDGWEKESRRSAKRGRADLA